jgi:hypothetical protein
MDLIDHCVQHALSFADGEDVMSYGLCCRAARRTTDAPAVWLADAVPNVRCGACGSQQPVRKRLCARCGLVAYCDMRCQRLHWRAGHRFCCAAADDEAERRPFVPGVVTRLVAVLRESASDSSRLRFVDSAASVALYEGESYLADPRGLSAPVPFGAGELCYSSAYRCAQMLIHYLARVSVPHRTALRAAGLLKSLQRGRSGLRVDTAAAPVVIWRHVLAAIDAGLDPDLSESVVDEMRASPYSWAGGVDIMLVLRCAHIQANVRAFASPMHDDPVLSMMRFVGDYFAPTPSHDRPMILQYQGASMLIVGCEWQAGSPVPLHIFVLDSGPEQCTSQDATGREPSRRLRRALSDPATIRSDRCVSWDAANLASLGHQFEVVYVGQYIAPDYAQLQIDEPAEDALGLQHLLAT